MAMVDFVVLGFPKCGTSAAMNLFRNIPGINICSMNSRLESPFYLNDQNLELLRNQYDSKSGLINGHKYAAYIYDPSAILRIKRDNPEALFVVCVRDPMRSAISWWQFHKNIAANGAPLDHFVNKDPDTKNFYINASIDDYYRVFARSRLEYTRYIRRLCRNINSHEGRNSKLLVLAQEYLAANERNVAETFTTMLGISGQLKQKDKPKHIANSDKYVLFPGSKELQDELLEEKRKMQTLFNDLTTVDNVKLLV